MERYFFHVTNGPTSFMDERGLTFSSAEEAAVHARSVADEFAKQKSDYEHFKVWVADEHGNEIIRVAICK